MRGRPSVRRGEGGKGQAPGLGGVTGTGAPVTGSTATGATGDSGARAGTTGAGAAGVIMALHTLLSASSTSGFTSSIATLTGSGSLFSRATTRASTDLIGVMDLRASTAS